MSRTKSTLLALGTALLLAGPAGAATLVSGVIYEGGVGPAAIAPKPDQRLGDFNATPGNPELKVVGDVSIWGGVAHSRKSRYTDAWAMDFGTQTYSGVFNWQNIEKTPFDGVLTVGGTDYVLGDSGSVSLTGLTGYVTFEVDPRKGKYGPKPREAATWDLHLATVPLPAGAWMMLSGLVALGALGRLKRRG